MNPELAALAQTQCGAFSRAQALRHHSVRTVERRLSAGTWRSVFRGVYCDASLPETLALRAHAALLSTGEGACFSHVTAAAIFGIDVGPQTQIHLTIPARRS